MANRPTITDLAAAAEVSVATVARVLNGRARVREETARRVFEAARAIGYHGSGLIEMRLQSDRPKLTIGYVLHKEKQAFYQAFRDEAERAAQQAATLRARAIVDFSPSQAPSDFVACLERMADRGVDVVAATAITHVDVADCVERIQARGIPCFALLNDFAQGIRQGYLGLNNMKVGRIAGYMLATAIKKPGKIGVFVGGYRWHGHELRETGLKSYFRENAQQFTVLDALVNLETRQLTYEATLDLLDRNPDLAGIYCAGGGMEGAITALREARRPGEVALVVNELTPESRRALIDRYVTMVISTPLEKLCTELVALAAATIQADPKPPPSQHFLQPGLYLPESV